MQLSEQSPFEIYKPKKELIDKANDRWLTLNSSLPKVDENL